jgi:uncharacterized membrane protein YeaQ/YmgE (transglycosylase-associated protein family)
MTDVNFSVAAQEWIHHGLTWVGFGTVVGLLAKAIMPGRDPGGAVATLLMGITGTFIGCSVLMYCTGGQRISPISPLGFVVGTAGSFVILFFYRMFGGGLSGGRRSTDLSGPHFSMSKSRSGRRVEQD